MGKDAEARRDLAIMDARGFVAEAEMRIERVRAAETPGDIRVSDAVDRAHEALRRADDAIADLARALAESRPATHS